MRIPEFIRFDAVKILQSQPKRREARRQSLGTRIGEHSRCLSSKRPRAVKFSGFCQRLKLFIRACSPEEKRQAVCKVNIRYAIGLARLYARRCTFNSKQKARASECRLNSRPDAHFKSAIVGAEIVKTQQGCELHIADRPAECLARQPRDDFLRPVPFGQDPWGILARVVEVTAVHRFEDRFSLLRQRPFDVQRCRE